MHGTPFSSHWSDTGLAFSGVEPTSIRSTPFFRINSAATSAARFGFDWLSLTMISTGCVLPAILMPSLNAVLTPASTN